MPLLGASAEHLLGDVSPEHHPAPNGKQPQLDGLLPQCFCPSCGRKGARQSSWNIVVLLADPMDLRTSLALHPKAEEIKCKEPLRSYSSTYTIRVVLQIEGPLGTHKKAAPFQ